MRRRGGAIVAREQAETILDAATAIRDAYLRWLVWEADAERDHADSHEGQWLSPARRAIQRDVERHGAGQRTAAVGAAIDVQALVGKRIRRGCLARVQGWRVRWLFAVGAAPAVRRGTATVMVRPPYP
jgi:hypothetical protein